MELIEDFELKDLLGKNVLITHSDGTKEVAEINSIYNGSNFAFHQFKAGEYKFHYPSGVELYSGIRNYIFATLITDEESNRLNKSSNLNKSK